MALDDWVGVGVGSSAGWRCEGICCVLGPIQRMSQGWIVGVGGKDRGAHQVQERVAIVERSLENGRI